MRESRTYGSGRGARGNSRPYREKCCLLRCMSPVVAVCPEGANHQWRKNPPGELSIDPVADERLAGNRRGWSLVTKVASGRLSDLRVKPEQACPSQKSYPRVAMMQSEQNSSGNNGS
jgi:hypothetical protein